MADEGDESKDLYPLRCPPVVIPSCVPQHIPSVWNVCESQGMRDDINDLQNEPVLSVVVTRGLSDYEELVQVEMSPLQINVHGSHSFQPKE